MIDKYTYEHDMPNVLMARSNLFLLFKQIEIIARFFEDLRSWIVVPLLLLQ